MKKSQDSGSLEEGDEAALARTLLIVRRLLEKMETDLDLAGGKTTVQDYIKLLQIQQGLEEKRVRKIEVKWVDEHDGG